MPSSRVRDALRFERVDIVFGRKPQAAFPLIDAGLTPSEIAADTGLTVGAMQASFSVREGECLVLMGLSGSGKSTLVRAVNGLNRISRGRLLVRDGEEEVDVARCDAAALRRIRRQRVAMVFQQFGLLPWRTVADNVALGLELSGIPKAEIAARVETELRRVHLADWADRRVQELSGGMQQRVGLARAFATEAPILLMDEPFSALDPLIRDKLQDELIGFRAELKRTILFVSHDLDEAMKLGDRIAIMAGGRVVQVGTAQEIMLAPATPYVAEFVAHMNPLNVLRAADVMTAAVDAAREEGDAVVARCAPIREVMAASVATGRPVLVEDGGQIVGAISSEAILKAILRK
ncbi:glycine betaine transporter subunit; ATP-binding compoent of ABC superfamily [uncultured Pleomorphomonas sp.]|uniref:Glycine betaine transporter subunit ATP-binding compoent of ABC superfamily n=1 Tax=uncultured Pleomorphomonas sp. TaxID=442121 RepID=A0A212LI76_9HYPH|nr:choline ABC transporter ATP-binding protein [uncultured Pleomorphomonas sp.]SCM77252.1 glycine betaine transporter subunit; ATP-binding compoent of ABC superfamily [uncultured Pleomorphomonas sp.]